MSDSNPVTGKTRILIYDVESSPNLAWIWNKYQQDAVGDFVKSRQIIAFAYKWLGEKEIRAYTLKDFPTYKNNPECNRMLIEKLHEVLSQADIVVAHNGIDFDNKMAYTDFIKHGMEPTPPFRTVDTLQFARSKFRFNSNKLDDLGALLNLGRKVETGGFRLWVDCMRGDAKAWEKMRKYNKHDVALLERVYLKLRPWMMRHPSVNIADGHDGCPMCRSSKIIAKGFFLTNGGKRPRFKCKDCGKWFSGKLKTGKWVFT